MNSKNRLTAKVERGLPEAEMQVRARELRLVERKSAVKK